MEDYDKASNRLFESIKTIGAKVQQHAKARFAKEMAEEEEEEEKQKAKLAAKKKQSVKKTGQRTSPRKKKGRQEAR